MSDDEILRVLFDLQQRTGISDSRLAAVIGVGFATWRYSKATHTVPGRFGPRRAFIRAAQTNRTAKTISDIRMASP